MQKTLEILKKEDGLVIKRLSYKKLLFVHEVPILLGDSSDVVVGYLPLKIRYRTSKLENNYECCDLTKLYREISRKYQTKIASIGTIAKGSVTINIQGSDLLFDKLITGFYISDKAWIRDHYLKNILK